MRTSHPKKFVVGAMVSLLQISCTTTINDETHQLIQESDSQLLTKHLSRFVRFFSRSFHIYNYVKREDLKMHPSGPLTPEDQAILDSRIKSWSQFFFSNENPVEGRMVKALYFAADPVASRAFGGPNWILLRIEVPENLKYLELDSLELAPKQESVDSVLKRAECPSKSLSTLIREGQNPLCRQLIHRALRELGVSILKYRWATTQFQGCQRKAESAAFIMIDDSPFDRKTAVHFSISTPVESRSRVHEQRIIAELFRRAIFSSIARSPTAADEAIFQRQKLWQDLPAPSPTEVVQWIENHLQGCHP